MINTQEYQVETVTRNECSALLRDCVCSNCWGELSFHYAGGGMWLVVCPRCEKETRGYVSKRYAERARARSVREYVEAKRNLRAVLGLGGNVGATRAMKDIGFKGD